ncbi:hypothetical protein [Acidovorax sp. SDU_ACID1]|uniref:hypothetical protein n=1 Tax=Acidovorax sp. SDU_ACID1 TaxID=3136632 RepID=UPI0038730B35
MSLLEHSAPRAATSSLGAGRYQSGLMFRHCWAAHLAVFPVHDASVTMASVLATPSLVLAAPGMSASEPIQELGDGSVVLTTLPTPPLASKTSPPRCENATSVLGLFAVLLPLMVRVAGA